MDNKRVARRLVRLAKELTDTEARTAASPLEDFEELVDAAEYSIQFLGKLAADKEGEFVGKAASRTMKRLQVAVDNASKSLKKMAKG